MHLFFDGCIAIRHGCTLLCKAYVLLNIHISTNITCPEHSTESQDDHGKEDNGAAYSDDHFRHIGGVAHLLCLTYRPHKEEGAVEWEN